MKGLFSPMEDFTTSEIVSRQTRQREAIHKAIQSIDQCEIFCDALVEYAISGVRHDSLHTDDSVLYPAASVVNSAAWNVVIAAANYHCASAFFDAQQALCALDCKEA
jgi:hypothetical protein